MREMGAALAKAHFLSLLDEVEAKHEPILVTKNVKPVARILPLEIPEDVDPLDAYHFEGIEIIGDITTPLYTDEESEGFLQATLAQMR